MPKAKWIPTQKELKLAWNCKKKKYTETKIAKELGVSKAKYETCRKVFNSFFIQSRGTEENKSVIQKIPHKIKLAKKVAVKGHPRGATKLKLEDINLQTVQYLMAVGTSKDDLASFMGICKDTFYRYCKLFPELQHVINNGKRDLGAKTLAHMVKSSKDRMVKDNYVSNYLGEVTIKEYKKYQPGSVSAQKHIMANTVGWTAEPKPAKSNHRGVIIRMIDSLMMEPEENETKKKKK